MFSNESSDSSNNKTHHIKPESTKRAKADEGCGLTFDGTSAQSRQGWCDFDHFSVGRHPRLVGIGTQVGERVGRLPTLACGGDGSFEFEENRFGRKS